MADERDEIQSQDAPVTIERKARISPDAPRLITAAAIGAAVGAAVTHVMEGSDFFDFGRSGDEAPIRVKGGSTVIDVLDESVYWRNDDGKEMFFDLSDGTRSADRYTVVVVTEDAGDVSAHVVAARSVKVYVGGDKWIEFKSVDHHTTVTSNKDKLGHKPKSKRLSHGHNVKKVVIDDKQVVFDESARPKLEEVLLLDNYPVRRRR